MAAVIFGSEEITQDTRISMVIISLKNFVIKIKKKLKIKIVPGKEPFYCSKCKEIKNIKCFDKKCLKKHIKKISGSHIRNLLKKEISIPDYLMSPKISRLISKKSLIK